MNLLKVALSGCIVTMALGFNACKHEPELPPGTPEVCFQNEVLPIFQSNCTMSGCHDGIGRLQSLASYTSISDKVTAGKPRASELYKLLTASKISGQRMPPSSRDPLTDKQLNTISLWILQGAKNTCEEKPCDSVNVTFSGTILPITELNCKGCHSGSNPSGSLTLIDYPTIKSSVLTGKFMGSVLWLAGFKAMPNGGSKISDCSIAQLKKWINNGMPNN